MNALEWNPAFGPVASALIVLGAGAYFYFLFRRLLPRYGQRNTWLLLSPKLVLVTLLVLALLDPDYKYRGGNTTPAKVLILQDISSSMDLRDDDSTRAQRATSLIHDLESGAPETIKFQVMPFDTSLHDVGYVPKDKSERGTDLAAIIENLATNQKLTDADGVILVTDGGDETVELTQVPTMPLGIVGVGNPPDGWNDIGIGNITAPATVEEKSEFDIEADLYSRPATPGDLKKLKVTLEEGRDKQWTVIQTQAVDLSAQHAAATFHVQLNETGALRYRVSLPQLPGELTYANNTRVINVQVQQRALHVLFFSQELDVNYKYLRNELGTDPGVVFTAMYRVLQDQFTVQGDRTGFQDLAQGFPTKDDVLKRYDCLILGSSPATAFSAEQMQALVRYVENGGALILLGGDASFGRGGYADSKLAPLMPWAISNSEADLLTGSFPITVAPSAAAVDFTSGIREGISAAGSVSLDSLNQPGGLRPGAVALIDATVSGHDQPVIAWQRYGKGQVLGIATNTMWKWAASGGGLRDLYGKFWRQSVRGLTKKLEGGALLGVHWNRDQYRPGEQAMVEITNRAGGDAGNMRLVATIGGPGGDKDVTVTPVTGQAGAYTAKLSFSQRGNYTFRLIAYNGTSVAESYERVLPVEPLVEESASPELKDAYLREIATKSRGIYTDEKHLEPIKTFLKGQVVAQQATTTVSLTNVWNLFPILVILILVAEWIVRRRFNLI